jgi:hypothetical protein
MPVVHFSRCSRMQGRTWSRRIAYGDPEDSAEKEATLAGGWPWSVGAETALVAGWLQSDDEPTAQVEGRQ